MSRPRSLVVVVAGVVAAAAWGLALAGGEPAPTLITIWGAPRIAGAFGGQSYGGTPPAGALISDPRELTVVGGEATLTGVPPTLDPTSVQLRDLTDPDATVLEQRLIPASATPTELLGHHLGEPITVVTAKGELTGALRAVDDQSLVLEIGAGDQRQLHVLRRDGLQTVRLAGGAGWTDKPALAWRLRTARPGKHSVVIDYRADGMTWTMSYLAVLDDAGKALDFAARALVKNSTGGSFERAALTLVAGAPVLPLAGAPIRVAPPPAFVVAAPVRIAAGDAVQVDLIPPRLAAPVHPVITFEALRDPATTTNDGNNDCARQSGAEPEAMRSELALELALPPATALPDGKVRLYRRHAGATELVSEDDLRLAAGVARIRVAPAREITGQRRATACTVDEHAHSLREIVEVAVDNKAKQAADVVVREYLWRWPAWRIEAEDHKGTRAGRQSQEYRLHVPAGGAQRVTYTVVYAW
jgi:hypothetical protein